MVGRWEEGSEEEAEAMAAAVKAEERVETVVARAVVARAAAKEAAAREQRPPAQRRWDQRSRP